MSDFVKQPVEYAWYLPSNKRGDAAFILSGWPHDKEAGNFGRMLRPLLPDEVLVKAGV